MNDRQKTFGIGSARGLWITVSATLSEAVMTSIDREEQLTTTVPYYSVKPRSAELVIVSLDGKAANYLGISQAGRRIATGLITVAVSNVIPIDELTVKGLQENLPNRFKHRFTPPASGAYRPSPALWNALLQLVTAQRPGIRPKLK